MIGATIIEKRAVFPPLILRTRRLGAAGSAGVPSEQHESFCALLPTIHGL
jgi:hypothetical protein